MRSRTRAHARGGFTIVEVSISAAILGAIFLIAFGVVMREDRLARSTVAISVAETHAQEMLNRLERQLSDARAEIPRATLASAASAADVVSFDVDTTLGFPDRGLLLVDRGMVAVERVLYGSLGPAGTSFRTLGRGAECTTASIHAPNAEVLWAGLAQVVVIPGAPPASAFDGRAREPEGTVFFRGDGTGFSYRVPTDPAGGDDVLAGGDIQWGATVGSVPTLSGWAALVFAPRDTFAEATARLDVNRDGDEVDVFDVGQIRAHAWDTSDPTVPADDIGFGPAAILQERCRHGGDLDGDARFSDPIFLWDPELRRLHVRLFILGRSSGQVPAIRRVESMIFLRNEVGS